METGACPHTAIRDDVTQNLLAVEDLERDFAPVDVVLVESGGDNLTATFSPALVDAQFFVLDVAGGGDVARKGGPGIARADALIVNKTDLAPYVGVDVEQMVRDAEQARDGRTVIALSRDRSGLRRPAHPMGAGHAGRFRAGTHVPVDPGPMAPHAHADGTVTPTADLSDSLDRVELTTRIVVERAGERHRVFARPGLIRAQTIRNDARSCRIGLLATTRAAARRRPAWRSRWRWVLGRPLELFDVAGTVAYHGRGRPAAWHTTARVAAGGTLRWSGEPFVVADGADVQRTLDLDLDAAATLRLRETLVLGRSGEVGGRLRNRTGIRVGGEPVLLEDQLLDPAGLRGHPGMLGDRRVIDTVITVGGPAPSHAPGCRPVRAGRRSGLAHPLSRSELAASAASGDPGAR